MTCSELHRDESENALPERFWHRVQLQAVTIAGSPSTVMLSCPHWQVAVRIPSYLLLPSLSENHTASSRLGKPFWLLRRVPAGLADSDENPAGRSNSQRLRHSLPRRDLELAGDVTALLGEAAEAVRIALHLVDMGVAFLVQRPEQFAHALE
jgi:hypothetical protein